MSRLLLLSSTLLLASLCRASPSPKNVLGGPLQVCDRDPMTGWYRDGYCNTDRTDQGTHVVCAVMTEAFLAFTKSQGNDLSTPSAANQFPGLKPGDAWCLCAIRWSETLGVDQGRVTPPLRLAATHSHALDFVSMATLRKHQYKQKK